MCALSDNKYGIEFLQFAISDYETKKIIFSVDRNTISQDMFIDKSTSSQSTEYRRIRYQFSEDVLRLPNIETSLVFKVGKIEVRDFRMIERHYFRGRLVKSFDFSFGYCIPGSTNTWDAVYSLPPMDEDIISDMISHPYETLSDSFYFVGRQLVMHNKASYAYHREDSAQAKKSYESKFGYKGCKDVKCAKITANLIEAKISDCSEVSTAAEMKMTDGKGIEREAKLKAVAWSKDEDYI